jgi:dTDP-4-amino-4,6-dideoxygalactose transaminase
VSCANGTDALYLVMAALKVQPGDEVITTAHSWIGTSAMITHAGANVVFAGELQRAAGRYFGNVAIYSFYPGKNLGRWATPAPSSLMTTHLPST